jgi:hypothetical protein
VVAPSRLARLTLLAVLALAASFAAAPAAGAASFVIKARGSQTALGEVRAIGDFKPSRNPRLAAAIRAYGQPTTKSGRGEVCRVRWARIGVRIRFQNFGAVDSCEPRHGLAQNAVIKGDPRWRTDKGLHIGDSVGTLRRLHPRARRTSRGFRLVEGVLPFGRPTRYAVLGARVANGRVSAFTLFIGEAGD